jgi:hypothetical protein
VTKPAELQRAEVIEAICQRYHCLPDAAEAADVSVLRHIAILRMGQREE